MIRNAPPALVRGEPMPDNATVCTVESSAIERLGIAFIADDDSSVVTNTSNTATAMREELLRSTAVTLTLALPRTLFNGWTVTVKFVPTEVTWMFE